MRWTHFAPRVLVLATVSVAAAGRPGLAGEPLHRKIDAIVESQLKVEPAAPATDAEFLRRVSLDLTGVIPTSDEARAFLDDPSPYKRSAWINRLLDSPAYAWRMAEAFDVMLMERRADANVPAAQWRSYLRQAFAENRPYDELVAEILSADGTGTRAPAKFLLDREAEPNQVTRDLGRMFLGRDMQCAQCHDHPLVDDYKQAHYYGLFAYVSRTSLFDQPGVGKVLSEKGDGEVTFASVFKKGITHKTTPHVLDAPAAVEPEVPKGAEYLLAPDKDNKYRPIPRLSRRSGLAKAITAPEIPDFRRNIANRLWALMMGRGIVHPLDMHHGDNPPTHPELLNLLADAIAASHYDVKGFLREVALSRTYQRSSEPPPAPPTQSPGETPAEPPPLAVASLKPLSPEQLGWSVLQGLGILGSYRRSAEAKYAAKSDPKLAAILDTDPKRRALRTELIEVETREPLVGNIGPFVAQFAAAAGQPQDANDPTVHQALFLSNGEPLQSWLAPSGDRLVGKLVALTDPSAVAEELYLSLYTRRPTPDERDAVKTYLDGRKADRPAALKELTWALLASTEFRFNH